jgi:hypothetical protein
LIKVALIESKTGLCQACTEKQLETSRHTISLENPTASFQLGAAMECATTNLWNGDATRTRKVSIPFGYVDEQFVDEGGMGLVFRALELSTGRIVAIKMLHAHKMSDDLIARFAIEAKALASLRHQNVVFLYEFQERAKPPYLVMEYVDGTSAHARLKAITRFEINEAVQVIQQAATGVHVAHQQGVIHRDIKPSNLLIDKQGVVKLTDFGLAKRLNENDALTLHGGIAGGTPGYMAPEQVNPQLGEFAEATDIWGLGATLYALLTGRPPYPSSRNDILAVLSKNHKTVREVRPEVSPVLDAIVNKCLAFQQADRYPSAEAVASDLNNYLLKRPTVVRPPTWAGRLWHTARNIQTPTVVAWSLALLVLAIIGASFFTKQAESRVEPPVVIRETEDTLRKAYFAECREKLKRNETVKLIGDDGDAPPPPEHVAWQYRGYQFTKPFEGEGAAHLISGQNCLAVLLDDPGIDRYTLRGEFKQIGTGINNSTDISEKTFGNQSGFAIGWQHLKRRSGKEDDSFIAFKYDEGWKNLNDDGTKSASVKGHNIHYGENGYLKYKPSKFNMGEVSFQPKERLPGEWRYLEIHVSPEDIVPKMGIKGGKLADVRMPTMKPLTEWYLELLNAHIAIENNPPMDAYVEAKWNPRRPLGIWCESSSILLRNIEVVPVVDKSKD